jgi:hypothetical protein
MDKPTLYWHIHHEILMEETTDIQERIDYIRKHKKEKEIPVRLKLMTPVLHPEKLPVGLLELLKAYDKAEKAYYESWKAHDKPQEAYYEVREAYYKVWYAFNKAQKVYTLEIEKLHKEEHPECPWNGKTIFSEVQSQSIEVD